MTLAELQPHGILGEFTHVERTSDQEIFLGLTSKLDLLKFAPQLKTGGPVESWSQRVKLQSLRGLSETSEEFLHHERKVTLFVEYETDVQRRFGLRNGDREIMFVLDRERQACVVLKGERQGKAGQEWVMEIASEIPIEDGFLLAERVDSIARKSVR